MIGRTPRRGRLAPVAGVAVLGAAVILAGAIGVGLSRRQARLVREELAQARADIEGARFATARERLTSLAERHPDRADIWLALGDCEQALGRLTAAEAAWERVAPGTPEFLRAATLRGTRFINTGRYRPAEDVLVRARAEAAASAPADRRALDRALSRLYRFEGRVEDVRRVLRDSWADSDNRPELLKELWLLDYSPQPIESWSRALDRADQGDDRVLLGRAVVAILSGDYDEAARRLDQCETLRAGDPAVARARLERALAVGDEAEVWRAAQTLRAGESGAAEPLALRAWLLGRRDDAEAERNALRALVDADASRIASLDRLASLEARAGHRDEADRLRRRKSALDDAKDRFRKLLLGEAHLAAHAVELAELAATLGRVWDAWAWGQLAPAAKPGVNPPRLLGDPASGTLADRLAALGLTPSAASGTVATAKRPSATPGERPPTAPEFTDAAETAGLAAFTFDNGETPLRQLPETMSGGVALLDFDGDGWLDVYAVQGGPLDGSGTGDRLFRNRGDGTFEDLTTKSGLAAFARGYGHGVTVGDFDNDGHPDVFVTRLRTYGLYRNRGDGTFEDATARSGLAGSRDAPSSAAFGDLDNDGDLDLYVTHYMIWDPEHPRLCPTDKGTYFYCDPSKVDAGPDHVFRNDGGRFVDVTREAGFVDTNGRGLGVVIADLDGDGRADVYVANDGTANYLFRNRGDWHFEDVAHDAGVAGNAEGGYQASMGVACGDQDGDGQPDLLVTNFYGESSTLYQNLGQGFFADRTAASGVGPATRYVLGFGTAFLDYDNDGRLDLLTTNGHVNDNRPYYPYAMPAQLLSGRSGGRLVDVSARAGGVWGALHVGRGLAVGDVDNDGRVDAVVLAQNEPLAYLHNQTPGGHFLTLRLEGSPSNRDAVGAVVTVTPSSGSPQTAWRFGGGSYQSASDPRLHFGLGSSDQPVSVAIRWPSGRTSSFKGLALDAGYRIREGDPAPRPLTGFGKR